jgi:nucleotidyltransferase/DNA polymerase involved in DNA repair
LLDEAYLDVWIEDRRLRLPKKSGHASAPETGLTASAGVSYNKFLAKLASDYRKPDGLFVITPRMASAFVERLPIGKFHGVGPVTAAKMNKLGIRTGLDLRQQTRAFLTTHFGKTGDYFYHLARAQDDRPVVADEPRKSLGAETTFPCDVRDWEDVAPALEPVFAKLWGGLQPARPNRTDRNREDQVRQLPADHSPPILHRGDHLTGDHRAAQPRSSSAALPAITGCAAAWSHAVELRCHRNR